MAETEEKSIKMAGVTIWCDKLLLKEFKAAVKLQGGTLAEELNGLFRRRLAEFRGIQLDPNSANAQTERLRHYESVKKRQFELHQEQLRMQKFFEDQKKGFLSEMLGWYVQATTGKHSDHMADTECWDIIYEAIDDDQKFRRQACKFLAAFPNYSFAYDFVDMLERIREKRKLQRQMLQFQAESLGGKEECAKLEEEERLKRELEAKAEEQKRVEEAERKGKEAEQRELEREVASKRRWEREKRLQEDTGNNGEATGEDLPEHDDEEEDTAESGEEGRDDEEVTDLNIQDKETL